MIEFKNRLTGTLMAVAPEREAEYLAAGHTRVDPPAAAAPARQTAEEPAEEPTAKQTAEEPAEADRRPGPEEESRRQEMR